MALRDTLRIIVLRFVAQRLVTPFTPYVLADAFLASEVHKYGLRGLNPRAVDLAQSDLSTVSANPLLFVQVNQLDDFCRDVLPKIVGPFTLITGKWHLPALQRSDYVTTILGSRHLNRWYSQNQVFDDLPILPFPYGVKLSSAPHVYWRMLLQRVLGLGRSGVFVPHVAAHEHLDGVALEARRQLEGVMGPRLKLTTYLNKILRHKFVISPPGDRMDTYRHWESIALGAIPVSNLPRVFSRLFGDALVSEERFDLFGGLPAHPRGGGDVRACHSGVLETQAEDSVKTALAVTCTRSERRLPAPVHQLLAVSTVGNGHSLV